MEKSIKEMKGIAEIQSLINDFLNGRDGSEDVRKFLGDVAHDEELLLRYLKGRKGRPQHAWETLRRYAEVRFDIYPDLFPNKYPETYKILAKRGDIGILKGTDRLGRRVMCIDASHWDPDEYSYEHFVVAGIPHIQTLIADEIAITKGVVLLQNSEGLGVRHAREYTLSALLKAVRIYTKASPLQTKGMYFVNTAYAFALVANLVKPLLPRKLKKRISITSSGYDEIHKVVPPEMLPKCFGGPLEFNEAMIEGFFG